MHYYVISKMFANIVLLLFVFVNGFSSLLLVNETERTTSNWIECPSNIGPLTKCFSNSNLDCYCLVSERMIRENADHNCHNKQMNLLSIESQVENEFVINLVNENKNLIKNQFWITGYNANLNTNNWVWQYPNLNITKPFTYQNWCPNEPNNFDSQEHFMAIVNNCWHDVPGNFHWPSVCKRQANVFDPNLNRHSFYTFPGERNAVVPCRPAINVGNIRVDISKEMNKESGVYYQIISNGTSVVNKNYEYDPIKGFVIRNVSIKDNGTYRCAAFQGMKEAWQLFHFFVTGVKLKVEPPSDPLLEGSNLTLKCDSQKLKRRDPPFDPVEWSAVFSDSTSRIETILTPTNSVVLPTGVQLKFSNETENEVATLMISNVSIAMSGSYRCQSTFHGSENSVQLMSNPFAINILKKVDWSEKIQRQELKGILTPASTTADNYRVVPVRSDLRISCTFGTSGYLPYYQWQWEQFDDNPEYTSQRNEDISSRLTVTRTINSLDGTDNFTMLLKNVTHSDAGLFTCVLNGSPSMSASQYIYVDDRIQSAQHDNFYLVKSSSRNTYNRSLGQPSIIPCRPAHPSIGIDISKLWKRGEIELIIVNGTSSDDNYEFNPQKGFIIHRVLPEHDELEFQCSATGNRGKLKEKTFSIMVTGVYVECAAGCTSSQRINGLLNSQVNPIAVRGENKIELNCYAYLNKNEPSVFEWYFISDAGVESKISSYLKAQTEIKLSPTRPIINTKNEVISRKLTISNVTEKSFGTYKCLVQADVGNYSESINLEAVSKNQADQTVVIASVTIGVVLLLMAIAIFLVYLHKNDKKKLTELEQLLRGNSSQMNPNEPLDEQIDLLPYDKRWEFPRNRLTLGKQLGVGCFARVVQAQAVGINDGSEDSVSTVAVKMVRSRTNAAAFEGLISELKILIHLGAHVNILNLLGACTKRINRGELLVIVEYCHYGNLRTFIIDHRETFVNQVDENGELIASDVENDADDVVTTRKLICWSFQIARGMDFLVSKKVLHGDLAARNILLADHNVVKVADFGLSRQLYKDENYMKSSKGLLPLKWMAIESLTDRIWSSRSDVWSYGIVLWEIFSLGKMPYQGFTDEFAFLQALKNDYRMEKPEHTPNCVAQVLEGCWKADPNQRPTFSQIEASLDGPLESFVTSFYLQLNEDYQRLNFDKRTYENFSVKPDHSSGKTECRKLARLASPLCRLTSTTNKDGDLSPKVERTVL